MSLLAVDWPELPAVALVPGVSWLVVGFFPPAVVGGRVGVGLTGAGGTLGDGVGDTGGAGRDPPPNRRPKIPRLTRTFDV
ncbi:hypothetical protein [Pseudomonas sp. GL93]|uniref:hypothetical protein n=1 Tax=Pseudomonas sp. GL93 TaxID=2014741 RepID=UPI001058D8B2|nr:hypothetical protein [Pseudomonas sp. GL93]